MRQSILISNNLSSNSNSNINSRRLLMIYFLLLLHPRKQQQTRFSRRRPIQMHFRHFNRLHSKTLSIHQCLTVSPILPIRTASALFSHLFVHIDENTSLNEFSLLKKVEEPVAAETSSGSNLTEGILSPCCSMLTIIPIARRRSRPFLYIYIYLCSDKRMFILTFPSAPFSELFRWYSSTDLDGRRQSGSSSVIRNESKHSTTGETASNRRPQLIIESTAGKSRYQGSIEDRVLLDEDASRSPGSLTICSHFLERIINGQQEMPEVNKRSASEQARWTAPPTRGRIHRLWVHHSAVYVSSFCCFRRRGSSLYLVPSDGCSTEYDVATTSTSSIINQSVRWPCWLIST